MDMLSGKIKNFFLKGMFAKIWGKYRSMPIIAPKSFSKLWEERNKGIKNDQ
jgi:L-lactate dehydrogenase complex protein LldF